MDRLTFEEVAALIRVDLLPPRWQDRIINHPRFPKPIDGTWLRDDVAAWSMATKGPRPAEAIDLTREELEEETVSLSEDLVNAICEAAGNRCQCTRWNCHATAGVHGLPVRAPRLKIFPVSGRWPRPVGPADLYGVLCLSCGNETPRSAGAEFADDV